MCYDRFIVKKRQFLARKFFITNVSKVLDKTSKVCYSIFCNHDYADLLGR